MSEQRTIVSVWKNNWQSSDYRKKLVIGLILISFILLSLPFFTRQLNKEMELVSMIIYLPGFPLTTYRILYSSPFGRWPF